MNTVNPSVRTIVASIPGPPSPRPIMARISAKMIQPTTSLKTAAATVIMPRSVRKRLRSISVLAITGRAEIDSAVATNRAKISRSAPASAPSSPGAAQAPAKPIANGARMPVIPTMIAFRPCRQTVERSISMPATSRNRAIATVVMPRRATADPPRWGKSSRRTPVRPARARSAPAECPPSARRSPTAGPSAAPAHRESGRRRAAGRSPRTAS